MLTVQNVIFNFINTVSIYVVAYGSFVIDFIIFL